MNVIGIVGAILVALGIGDFVIVRRQCEVSSVWPDVTLLGLLMIGLWVVNFLEMAWK